MAGMMDSLATINSAVRTFLALIVVGLLGIGGYYGYSQYNKSDLELREKEKEIAERDQRIKALESDLDLAKKRAEKLEIALRLHKVEHRLAYVDVMDRMVGADGKNYVDVEFTEIIDGGEPVSKPKKFRLVGTAVYVEGLIVKFDDIFVENADPDRGVPLVAFKRIHGGKQAPDDGFPLDAPGQRPAAYGGTESVPALEQSIWDNFWTIAHDEKQQEKLGVRSLHGQSVSMGEVRKGWRYEIILRSSGEMAIISQGEMPMKPVPTF